MSNISFYLDKRRAKKDGSYPIKLYISHHKKFYVATPFSSKLENWDINQFSKAEPNYKIKNISLRSLMNRAEDVIYNLEKEEKLKSVSDSKLKDLIELAISDEKTEKKDIFSCFDEFVATKQKQSTIETYLSTKKKILDFDKNCSINTIDKKWLLSFDVFMLNAGLKTNSRSIHMRNLRAIFNYAIDEELTSNYPFRKFPIKKEETRKRSLTVDQLIALRNYPCEGFQEKYKDIFMLMFYLIGINAIDLFNAKEIKNGRIEYRRAKTNKLYSIKVEPEAMSIINKYRGDKFILNILDECKNYKDFLHRMGNGLKKIGECKRKGRGGKKEIKALFPDISSYWSRHTWATIASFLDIPKETISAALGHEIGSSVTSIYIKYDQNKVDQANRMVIDYVNNPEEFIKNKAKNK